MKKWIFLLFIMFGILSFSALDKIIIGIVNDNYESPIMSGTINRGGLANFLFGAKKNGDFAKHIYGELSNSDKLEFIIEKHDEAVLVSILKIFEKNKYEGEIEVVEISSSENKSIREITKRNKWVYNVYPTTDEIPGTVKGSGGENSKGEIIKAMFRDAKEKVK